MHSGDDDRRSSLPFNAPEMGRTLLRLWVVSSRNRSSTLCQCFRNCMEILANEVTHILLVESVRTVSAILLSMSFLHGYNSSWSSLLAPTVQSVDRRGGDGPAVVPNPARFSREAPSDTPMGCRQNSPLSALAKLTGKQVGKARSALLQPLLQPPNP